MANFIISISEQIITPYTGASDSVTEESCNKKGRAIADPAQYSP